MRLGGRRTFTSGDLDLEGQYGGRRVEGHSKKKISLGKEAGAAKSKRKVAESQDKSQFKEKGLSGLRKRSNVI